MFLQHFDVSFPDVKYVDFFDDQSLDWSSTHIHGDDVVFIDKLMYQLKATPWVNWIFINTVFHLIWVTLLLLSQLYQVSISIRKYLKIFQQTFSDGLAWTHH